MRLVADLATRRCDGVGTRRKLARDADELLGGQRRRMCGKQVDHLPPRCPVPDFAAVDELTHGSMPCRGDEALGRHGRERRDVAVRAQCLPQRLVTGEADLREHVVDQGRVVLDEDVERVAGFIGQRRGSEAECQVDRLLVGA